MFEILDKGILKFNKFSMKQVKKKKKEQLCESLMYAFIKLYEISWLKWK